MLFEEALTLHIQNSKQCKQKILEDLKYALNIFIDRQYKRMSTIDQYPPVHVLSITQALIIHILGVFGTDRPIIDQSIEDQQKGLS